MTIEKLKGKRTASRGWVTRIVDNLDTLCEKTPCDYVLISEGIVDLDNKLKTLDIIQGQIEDLLPEKELEADIEDAYNFRQRAKTIRAKASCIGGIPTKLPHFIVTLYLLNNLTEFETLGNFYPLKFFVTSYPY